MACRKVTPFITKWNDSSLVKFAVTFLSHSYDLILIICIDKPDNFKKGSLKKYENDTKLREVEFKITVCCIL